MSRIWQYIAKKWKKRFPLTDEERFPVQNEMQKHYRKEFGDIVDQFLISYHSERNESHPDGYHHIVYIASNDNLYWIEDGIRQDEEPKQQLKENQPGTAVPVEKVEDNRQKYLKATSKLRNLLYAPLPNLPHSEIINFRKMIGMGCKAALSYSWQEVDEAIESAKKYREERSKEYSRFLLLSASTIYLAILFVLYIAYMYLYPYLYGTNKVDAIEDIPHIFTLTGMVMGALGAYVSIWTRYGKLDMTGLGARKVHYLEAFSRMLIGVIFAMIIIFAVRGNIVFGNVPTDLCSIYIYSILGFCAGFSEKWIPSVLEKFMKQHMWEGAPATPAEQPNGNNQSKDEKAATMN